MKKVEPQRSTTRREPKIEWPTNGFSAGLVTAKAVAATSCHSAFDMCRAGVGSAYQARAAGQPAAASKAQRTLSSTGRISTMPLSSRVDASSHCRVRSCCMRASGYNIISLYIYVLLICRIWRRWFVDGC